ncbi:MAG TPA: hypothetical protein VGJ97_11715 [Anaerolineaceae bacterium]|jgi:hypothetical protein
MISKNILNDSKFSALVQSRKFWAAAVGLGLVLLRAFKPDFPISDDQMTKMVLLLVAYILGVGLEDHGATRALK